MSVWNVRAAMGIFTVMLVTAIPAHLGTLAPWPPGTLSAEQLVPSGEGMPDGPGKDVAEKSCGTCHEARRAASVRLTRDGWAAVIDAMRARGAQISDENYPVVLEYLATNFLGEAPQPLNLNTATQIDLEAAGGLLRREAAAVIRYREQHGRFKSIDDLKNVPGLDFKKID